MATYQERREARYERLGEAVGGIFRDRWDAKEAEEFMQNEFQDFQNATTAFRNNLSTIEDGDQLASSFQEWKNNTFMPFLTSSMARYPRNERIMNIVKTVYDANNQGMDEYLRVEEAGHRLSTRGEREEMAKRKGEAEIAGMEAQATQRGAAAEESKARAGLLRAQTGVVGKEAEQQQWPNLSQVSDLPTVRQAVQNARVKFPDQVNQIQQRADAAAVSRIIQDNSGKAKPDGTKWGQDPQRDQQDAMIEWSASGAREKVLEASVAEAMGANLAVGQGYYDEYLQFKGGASPLLPEEKVKPLRAGAPPTALLPRILATTAEDVRQRGFNIESVDSFIKNTLPDLPMSETGYRQLGGHVTSTLEQAVLRDTDGQPISSVTRKPVKNYNELTRHLLTFWNQRVTQGLIEPKATALQTNSEALGRAIIAKYAPIIAMRLGIPIPKAKQTELQRMQEPFALQLLRSATEFAGDVVPSLLKNIGFGEEEL